MPAARPRPAEPRRHLHAITTIMAVAGLVTTAVAGVSGQAVAAGPVSLARRSPSKASAAALPGRKAASGVVVPSGEPAQVHRFASWRGTAVTSINVYAAQSSWSRFINPTGLANEWRGRGVRLEISVAPWPSSVRGSLAAAAAGTYDRYYRRFASVLASHGEEAAVLRFGWEFNGTWFPWSVRSVGTGRQFAAAFRRFVTNTRAVSHADFSYDWSISNGAAGTTRYLADAYPGNDYVTDIGNDVFDWDWNRDGHDTPAQRWANLRSENGDGLDWQSAFAAAHHKAISFPEWGEAVRYAGSESVGGNDDPGFVTRMRAWILEHNVSYDDYFEVDNGSSREWHVLTDGRFTVAARTYQKLF